ncbi:MAG: AAA family ATPase [Pseudomonas sp.]|uniref:AAA family ATPase n=1 Tax=Pseudomonas sp. TaxID=306 RepID=UPI00299ED960|nr:AAA family ATPase [Pseudomonas sp.]MDX1725152.1 AAA family ATPase [Pseudomonas sp.]
MTLSTNGNFARLISHLQEQGAAAHQRTQDTQEYHDFLAAYPLERLNQLTLDEYCVGKGEGASFCWWIERGLVPVLGRYMPGTAKGHILYFQADGSLYKNRRLADLSDEEALRYTLKIQSTIAAADPADMLWVDDDKDIYRRTGVEPRVTVAPGRKLRLLACYHPAHTLPISSSDHLGHYLQVLGCPEELIPPANHPVARMLKLREYYLLASESVPGLSPYGFMRGLYSDELGFRPAKPESEQDAQPGEPSYLLTWNPEHVNLGGDAGVALGEEVDWSCHSKQPQPGDVVYLARLGQDPRGIVARGVVTQGAHDAPDWKDTNQTRNYIRFRIDEHRPDCARGLLPMLLLNKALPRQRWNPQSSGIEIPPATAARLELLWQTGEGQHSLKQYVAWSSVDRKESHPGWLKRYQELVDLASALRGGQAPLDLPALERLWLDRDNGVSSLRQGVFSRKELIAQQAAVMEITQSIMAAPTEQTHAQVMRDWHLAVENEQFSANRPAMVNRVFAAFAPERFTSVLKPDDCQRLLQGLREQFQLQVPSDRQSWCGLNEQIMACMSQAGLDTDAVLPNNIAMWQLLEALQGVKGEEPDEMSEGDALMADKNIPLNQILFGPPGTGKTYATIEAALEILDPEALLGERAERKVRFDELTREGRVRFVTFHQSFSYEDFVEGLRAEPAPADAEGASSGVQYRVEAGVFLRLCREAVRNRAFEQRVGVRDDAKIWKISIEEASSTGLTRKYCFEHGEARIGWSGVGDIRKANLSDPSLKLGTNDQSSLANFGLNVEPGDVVVCLSTTREISAVGVVTGEYEYSPTVPVGVRKDYVHRLPVHWLATGLNFDITGLNQGVKLTLKTMYELWRISWPALQSVLLREGIALAGEFVQPEEAANQPYVLIIDEINRGNVSRILGELITLIEPSKRAGAKEALSVVLPYSKQRFSVPDNIYLIGTMNTADRSLAGLDIALRRRFVFHEMPPRPELLDDVQVQGLNIGQLLRVMNQRIEVLLDRDHCLGHAYFMPLNAEPSLERLESIFRNQILPLLQEYFFEDWQRIQWVLNDHRKLAANRFVEQDKQELSLLFGSISVPAQGAVWRIKDSAFKRISAYAGVIAVNAEAEAEAPAEALEELGA